MDVGCVVSGFLLQKEGKEGNCKYSFELASIKLVLSAFYLSSVFIGILPMFFIDNIYKCFNQNFDFIQYGCAIGLPVAAEVFLWILNV